MIPQEPYFCLHLLKMYWQRESVACLYKLKPLLRSAGHSMSWQSGNQTREKASKQKTNANTIWRSDRILYSRMWSQLEPTPPHVAYLTLSIFLIIYALFSLFIRNVLHLSEPPCEHFPNDFLAAFLCHLLSHSVYFPRKGQILTYSQWPFSTGSSLVQMFWIS